MPFKARTRGKQLVKHRTRLDRENNETLYAYAQFLGESPEYVLSQLIDIVLAREADHMAHPYEAALKTFLDGRA